LNKGRSNIEIESKKINDVVTNTSGLSDKKRRILKILDFHDYSLNAKRIALLTRINYSTVRSYLRQLNSSGFVQSPYRGYYVANPKYGMVDEPPKIHNLRLKKGGLKDLCFRRVEGNVGLVSFNVSFERKRGKIYGIIGCDAGLNYNETVFAISYFKDLIQRETGLLLKDDEIEVDSCECCYDYASVKLEGVQCVTVSNFAGTLERLHTRRNGLRSEVRVKPDSLCSILSLLKGGFPTYNIVQNQFVTNQKLSELTEAIKGTNLTMQKIWAGLMRYFDESKSDSEDK